MNTAREIIATHGFTVPEYLVACSICYRINLPPTALVHQTFKETRQEPLGDYSEMELKNALDSLISRKLVLVLDSASLEANRVSFAQLVKDVDWHQYYEIGHVDFAEEGFIKFRETSDALKAFWMKLRATPKECRPRPKR